MAEEKSIGGPRIGFVYMMCNEIEAIRYFYTDLLGFKELGHKEGAYVMYVSQGLQVIWFRAYEPAPVLSDFAMQPGWQGGKLEVTSFSLQVPPAAFAATVERLRAAGVPAFAPLPEWRQDSYWGYPVLDPMGNTIEVYSTPAEKPDSTEWPG